jgi:DNA-binding MarR family transcriptional regulator
MAAPKVLDCLCHNVRKASRLLTQLYDDALQPSGVRITQFVILAAVNQMGEPTFLPLAKVLGMDRTTLSRNVELLQRDGMVSIRTGINDKRQQVVTLTEKGTQALSNAMPLWESAQREAIKRLLPGTPSKLLQELADLSEIS